ncbi:MAG TPA: phosphoglycerate mutase family protein [Gemmatimonadaceae bacterium]|nr:phosphoglycerate mutase family protein [Gemmatimonadaceae bacterium]
MRLSCLLAAAFTVVTTAAASAQPAMVILVRHAERAAAPQADPVLTDGGAQRAVALKKALATAGVSAVVATQYQRTQLTAKPLMDSLGLTPVIVRAGNPLQAHLDSVAAAVRRQASGSVILVVGHSNTIPGIIAALGGPKMPDLCDDEYSFLYVMHYPAAGAPQLVIANYGAADAPGSGACTRTMRP